MPADKELTKRITHKDIKKRAKSLALPDKNMCKSAVGWELEIMCPNYKKTDYPELIGNYGGYPQFERSGSALRKATKWNPRNLPCPTCKKPNKLTPADKAHGYQCDECADRAEGLY
jgi:hypothetical protein